MIRHGKAPYLECSSRGDRRFSAFHARLADGWTIEERYQASKVFQDGSTGLHWEDGRKAINAEECAALYSKLWDQYIDAHPELLEVLRKATGLSDMFGQPGHCCQATELWRIKKADETCVCGEAEDNHTGWEGHSFKSMWEYAKENTDLCSDCPPISEGDRMRCLPCPRRTKPT